ncbi:MAG TPA: hypothetical protein VEC96_13890 [Anaerolineae bacterium]|nr:hypothetical protein [Anaerolineae bacterium]
MLALKEKISITVPPDILKEVDDEALENSASRSHMIVRIIKERKRLKALLQRSGVILADLPLDADDQETQPEPEPCAA